MPVMLLEKCGTSCSGRPGSTHSSAIVWTPDLGGPRSVPAAAKRAGKAGMCGRPCVELSVDKGYLDFGVKVLPATRALFDTCHWRLSHLFVS